MYITTLAARIEHYNQKLQNFKMHFFYTAIGLIDMKIFFKISFFIYTYGRKVSKTVFMTFKRHFQHLINTISSKICFDVLLLQKSVALSSKIGSFRVQRKQQANSEDLCPPPRFYKEIRNHLKYKIYRRSYPHKVHTVYIQVC